MGKHLLGIGNGEVAERKFELTATSKSFALQLGLPPQ